MKILYDHQTFAIQEFGGISRYFLELMNCYYADKRFGVSFDVSIRYSNNEYLEKFGFIYYRNLFKHVIFPGKGPFMNHINKIYSIPRIWKSDFDVFHPTYYDPYFLKYNKKPFVVTVYDMIHEIFPQYFPAYERIRKNKQKVIQKADKIIAISKNTKKDLMNLYNIESERIQVIYLGNPLEGIQQSDEHLLMKGTRYLLFVGNRQNYKNFRFFISAIEPVLKQDPDLQVICAGGGQFTEDERNFLGKCDLQTAVYQINVDDQRLKQLYSGAIAFFFPSLYEGFGLPVLEAFSCKCPAILSNTSSLPEVGGDAALYFDPADKESLRAAIERVLNDDNLRTRMINEGIIQEKKFSWQKTAKETKVVYQEVCN